MGGLALPQLLQAEAQGGAAAQRQKSVIMISWVAAEPSGMWDIKEDAPLEYRGEFNAIPTSVPGVRLVNIFPSWPRCGTNVRPFARPSGRPTITMRSIA